MIYEIYKHMQNEIRERIRAETIHERKDYEHQNIIIFQAKAYIKKIDNLIILFITNIKRTDDYALVRKIETLKKNRICKKSRIQIEKNLIPAYVIKLNQYQYTF